MRDMLDRLHKHDCIIELPFSSETIDMPDLTSYIKSKLNSIKRNVTDSVLQALSKCIYQQIDKQSQIFFLLRLVLNESYFSYLSQRKKKLDLADLNIEQILNAYIGKSNVRRWHVRIGASLASRSLRTEIRTEYLCVRLQLHQLVAVGRERTRTTRYSLVQ